MCESGLRHQLTKFLTIQLVRQLNLSLFPVRNALLCPLKKPLWLIVVIGMLTHSGCSSKRQTRQTDRISECVIKGGQVSCRRRNNVACGEGDWVNHSRCG